MINIYYSSTAAFDSPEQYLPLLPPDGIKKFGRFRDRNDACLFLLGRLLLLHGLAGLNRQDLVLSKIAYRSSGKPFFPDSSINFSISHSGEWAFCAISNRCEVGIDIEKKKEMDFSAFGSIFSTRENHMLANAADKKELFYSLWTRKEATVKADGCGIVENLSDIEIAENLIMFNSRTWHIREYDMFPDYSVSLVSNHTIEDTVPLIQCSFE